MERLTRYHQLVQHILHDYSQQKIAYGNIEVETIFDKECDNYQIVNVGWEGQNWVHSCIISRIRMYNS